MNKKLISFLMIGILLASCSDRDESNNINSNPQENPQNSNPTQPLTPPGPNESKPDDNLIGKNVHAKWEITDYLDKIDIADIYNGSSDIATELKKLVTFSVNTTDGKVYTLKDSDINDLSIIDLKYDGNSITFHTKYKNIKSISKHSLVFKAREFYDKKITINDSYVSTKYMRGIYENLPIGIGLLVNYDSNRYQIDYTENTRNKDDNNNILNVGITITDKKISNISKQITKINKEINNFKTLENLANDIAIGHHLSFRNAAKAKINARPNGTTDFTRDLKPTFSNNWHQYIHVQLKSENYNELTYSQRKLSGENINRLDIYLSNPRFELISAILKGSDLHIKIAFEEANDVYINKEYDVIMRNIINP